MNVVPRAEDGAFASKQQEFTYLEIQSITNNFQRVLGEGGFGKVYHGFLNGNEVAVKILSSPSIQGHRQFHAEACYSNLHKYFENQIYIYQFLQQRCDPSEFNLQLKLLLRVHHKNLTTLIGYCNEGTNVGLIYEYMAMGNLRSHISGEIIYK